MYEEHLEERIRLINSSISYIWNLFIEWKDFNLLLGLLFVIKQKYTEQMIQ